MSTQQILVVDDEVGILDVITQHLNGRGYQVRTCGSAEQALELLKAGRFDLVLTDLKMKGMNGLELCDRISGNHPDMPVLIMTAFGTLDVAIEAIRSGAYDFVVKPINFETLTTTIEKAMRDSAAKRRLKQLDSRSSQPISEGELLGESRSMLDLRALIAQIADLETSVFITGESGTGKALVSEVLHRKSRRATEPYVVVNCATIPEDTFEQDLFGRVEGSKAGKRVETGGLISAARGGTLFFDEIGHLPLHLQPKLLRLFEERLYRPHGASEELHCPARFVVATNTDLVQAVREGSFREDLFFRINVMHIRLAALRERGTDVLILAHHFLRHFAARMGKHVQSLSDPVTEKLTGYEWPGNVRELRNTIERAVAVTGYDHLVVEDLPEEIRRFRVVDLFKGGGKEELIPVDAVEQRHILGVLRELNGNKALAAKVLGMDRKTLYRKLERYGYRD